MAVSNAKRLSVKTYQQEKCDRLTADVPKGKRDEYKTKAIELGLSLSMLIQRGVESYGTNHAGESFTKAEKPENQLSEEERKLIDVFNQHTQEGRKAIVKLVETLAPKNSEVAKEELK